MAFAGLGSSDHPDPTRAARAAFRAARKRAGADRSDLVLGFATRGYEPGALLDTLRGLAGDAPVVGCSGSAVTCRAERVGLRHGLALATLASDDVQFTAALAPTNDPVAAAHEIASGIAGERPIGMWVFAARPDFDVATFGDAFARAVGEDVAMFGGVAADADSAGDGFVFARSLASPRGVAVVLLMGAAHMAVRATSALAAVGPEHTVTRTDGRSILELDARPVLSVITEYIGWDALRAGRLPLACLPVGGTDHDAFPLWYAGLAGGGVLAPVGVERGTRLQFAIASREQLIAGARNLAAELGAEIGGATPKLVLSSQGATAVRIPDAERERVALVRGVVGDDPPWIGFQGFGEIAPAVGRNRLWFDSLAVAVVC